MKPDEDTIKLYTPLVETIANQVFRIIPTPSNNDFDIEDLKQVGFLGLLEAIDAYDPGKNTLFVSYAKHRIRGKILDMVRHSEGSRRLNPPRREPLNLYAIHDQSQDLLEDHEDGIRSLCYGLSEETTEIMVLRYAKGMPSKEISAKIGKSMTYVSQRHSQGLRIISQREGRRVGPVQGIVGP